MSIIQCENLFVSYEGRPVIENLSFQVEEGDYLCIVGDNGSGKSTLMKTLLGLKKPDKGSITFGCGCAVNGEPEKSCRKDHRIGYLPQQNSYQKDFPANVQEIVLSGCLKGRGFRPFYSAADKKRANAAMERLGISDFKKKSFMDLSGGQQQRVLLARALCATEDFLFLDEPVAGLDPKVTLDLYEIIRTLNEDGITIIMISHDIESAVEYSRHILHLGSTGKFFGTTEEYRKTDLCEHFLCHMPDHIHHGDECEICSEHHHLEECEPHHLHTEAGKCIVSDHGHHATECCDHDHAHGNASENCCGHDHTHGNVSESCCDHDHAHGNASESCCSHDHADHDGCFGKGGEED